MPFTPAHIAAVLPLRNRWKLIWSALIIGSMAPDFEYLFTLGPRSHVLHDFPQVIYFTLPLAFAVFAIVQLLLRRPVLELLPEGIEERMDPPPSFFAWPTIGMVVLSLAIGIATHIAWDSFTHERTLMSEHFSVAHAPVPIPVVGPRQLYKVLQWLSSAFGLLVLAFFYRHWYSRTAPKRTIAPVYSVSTKIVFWMFVVASSSIFGVWEAGHRFGALTLDRWVIVVAVVSAMAAIFWEVTAFSVFLQLRRRWKMKQRTDVSASSTL